MPLRFIEEVGIECALWPNLYWNIELCETFVRTLTEGWQLRHADEEGWEMESDEEDEAQEVALGRTSIKKHFMRKVFGPII